MRETFLFLLCCLFSVVGVAQGERFAFVRNDQGKEAAGEAIDLKLKTAQLVFDSLVDGQGDYRRQRPSLVMNDGETYVAWARPETAEIGLEELAYDVCTSFGPDSLNALAALLTHELVHYYEKHEWSRHFVKDNQELSTAQQLEKLKEGLKLEAQADYLGGFLAYSVGFDVYGVMPKLLKKIYSEEFYDLPEAIDGYPSLADRIAMTEKSMENLYDLQLVFETAKYLSLLENHDAADKYYRYILQDFQSRDIFNNAGVNALLSTLKWFNKKEMPYALPIELDPRSRLQANNTRDTDLERQKRREKLIQTALDYFDRSLLLDQHYAPAFLNKAVCFVLLNQWDDAVYWLGKAGKEAKNAKLAADVLVLKGIIAAQQERLEEARENWRQARDGGSYLAEINLQVLESGPLEAVTPAMGFGLKKEQIDELLLDDFLKETAPDRMIKIDDQTICGFHQRPDSRIYSHSVDFGKEFFSVQVVDSSFEGKSMEGIMIGDNREKLMELYATPARQLQTPEGEFLVFPGRNLFFELDGTAEVTGWGVYRIK